MNKNYAYKEQRMENVLPKNFKRFTFQFMRQLHLKLHWIANYAELRVVLDSSGSNKYDAIIIPVNEECKYWQLQGRSDTTRWKRDWKIKKLPALYLFSYVVGITRQLKFLSMIIYSDIFFIPFIFFCKLWASKT